MGELSQSGVMIKISLDMLNIADDLRRVRG